MTENNLQKEQKSAPVKRRLRDQYDPEQWEFYTKVLPTLGALCLIFWVLDGLF